MSVARPNVTAIVVNYDNTEDTLMCIASLRKGGDSALAVCVVDNSPRIDSAVQQLREDGVVDQLIITKNNGFSAACNMGIRWAIEQGSGYIWLINNDLIIEPSTLPALLDVLEATPGAACCGPKIRYQEKPDEIQFAGGFIRTDAAYWHPRGDWEQDHGQYDCIQEVDWICGACMLIRTAALEDIGLLDERYFLYYEDVDWCVRACKQGWRCIYVGTIAVEHKASTSTKGVKRYYYPRAHLLFLAQHYPTLVLPALRRYYHHSLHPHLQRRAWDEVAIDMKVYAGFVMHRLRDKVLGRRNSL